MDKAGVVVGWQRKNRWNHQIDPDDDAPPKNLGLPTIVVVQLEEFLGDPIEADQENAPDEDHDADVPAKIALDGSQGGHDGVD